MASEFKPFPQDLLAIQRGSISGKDGIYSISLEMCPFTYEGEMVNANLELSGIPLQTEKIPDLSGARFAFPVNPADGYVETSIYIWHVHNPIDVLGIRFGATDGQAIEATLDMRFIFEYEGECANLEASFTVQLEIRNEP